MSSAVDTLDPYAADGFVRSWSPGIVSVGADRFGKDQATAASDCYVNDALAVGLLVVKLGDHDADPAGSVIRIEELR